MKKNTANVPKLRFPGFTDDWEQRKLGELGELKNGMNFSKDAMGHGFPFVNLQNIFGRNEINEDNLEMAEASEKQLKDYNLLEGDVLFVRSSVKLEGVGEAAVVSKTLNNTTYSGFIIRFRDTFGIDKAFKKYIFSTKAVRTQIMAQATNSANKNISQPVLENLTFMLPTEREQEKIGKYFSNLGNLITLHQRKLAHLQAKKKGLLQKMFPQQGECFPELRFLGFTDAWEQRKLEKIVDRVSNISNEAGFPRLEYEDIISGSGKLNKDIYKKESSKTGIGFEAGDILFGKLRPYLKNWLLADFQGIAVGDFWVLRSDVTDSKFLYYLIQTPKYYEVANQSTGTKMPRSDWNVVSKTEFLIPDDKLEQQKIGEFFANIDNLITLHQRKLTHLQKQKKALLQQMFV